MNTTKQKWWNVLLIISLMANLLVVGAMGGRYFKGWRFGGPDQPNLFIQLIPRKFIDDLETSRRRVLIDSLRQNRPAFKEMREASNAAALELAAVLENPNYDAAAVQSVIEKFAIGRESLAAKGSALVIDIISKLTPEERIKLAVAIKDRSSRGKK